MEWKTAQQFSGLVIERLNGLKKKSKITKNGLMGLNNL